MVSQTTFTTTTYLVSPSNQAAYLLYHVALLNGVPYLKLGPYFPPNSNPFNQVQASYPAALPSGLYNDPAPMDALPSTLPSTVSDSNQSHELIHLSTASSGSPGSS
ncbi:hypothetical protein CCACVL1_12902 [Corchorus capsularis]|uniref:Uncharacterized protein n=1 Tax=Corchorus capsularis TaxID=210143 RepID=A0A1R3IDB9_COCAP|nr:hypothetical protein CCACVL1_12902 [Corchorus capsularis]